MSNCLLHSTIEQDRFLLALYPLTHNFVRGKVLDDDLEDAVHDVMLHCLVRLRKGGWEQAPRNLQAFVRKLVRDHVVSRHRKDRRCEEYDHEHYLARETTPPEWVSPDRSVHEASIDGFKAHILGKLPERTRQAYAMVRENGATYGEAAAALDVSRETVHNYIRDAQRELRKELKILGLRASHSHSGGRPRITTRRWKKKPATVRYVAPRSSSRVAAGA